MMHLLIEENRARWFGIPLASHLELEGRALIAMQLGVYLPKKNMEARHGKTERAPK